MTIDFLQGKNCAIIGNLQTITRQRAIAFLYSCDAFYYPKVNSITDIVILGHGYQKTKLYKNALHFEKLKTLVILTEVAFLALVNQIIRIEVDTDMTIHQDTIQGLKEAIAYASGEINKCTVKTVESFEQVKSPPKK